MDRKKKPTRRKPSRQAKQTYFTTADEYFPPWATTLCGAMIGLLAVLIPLLLGLGRMRGWW